MKINVNGLEIEYEQRYKDKCDYYVMRFDNYAYSLVIWKTRFNMASRIDWGVYLNGNIKKDYSIAPTEWPHGNHAFKPSAAILKDVVLPLIDVDVMKALRKMSIDAQIKTKEAEIQSLHNSIDALKTEYASL